MTTTLKFNDKEQQLMVDIVHFFGRDEMTRKELRDYSMNFGIKWAPSFIVKNESCKSNTRGAYKLPVKRLHLMEKFQPSETVFELVRLRDEMLATLAEGSPSPITVIQGVAKAKAKAKKEKVDTTDEAPLIKKTAKKKKLVIDTTAVAEQFVPEIGAPVPSKKVSSKKQAIIDKMEKMRHMTDNTNMDNIIIPVNMDNTMQQHNNA